MLFVLRYFRSKYLSEIEHFPNLKKDLLQFATVSQDLLVTMFCVILLSIRLAGSALAEPLGTELLVENDPARQTEVCNSSAGAALAATWNLNDSLADACCEAMVVVFVFVVASVLLRIVPLRKRPARPSASKPAPRSSAKLWDLKGEAAASTGPLTEAPPSGSWQSSGNRQSPSAASVPRRPVAKSVVQHHFSGELDMLAQAARTGTPGELLQLLDQAYARAAASQGGHEAQALEEIAVHHLLAVLRSCASAHRFHHALTAYDHVAEKQRIGVGSDSVWSILLYNATEAGQFHRGEAFFQRLCRCTKPSSHDFVNVVRCYLHLRDLAGLKQMLANLHKMGHGVDAYATNRALAACTSTDSIEFAESIITHGRSCEALDAIGYNTLMKYHARAGSLDRCFELRADMSAKGLGASDVTFGILLDACVGAKEFDRARKVFEDLRTSGLRLNVVHCTTFLKGLVNDGRLDEANDVLSEMLRSPGAKPDLITYSILVKAYADRSQVASALRVLELMVMEGTRPDEIIFHSVLTGCCHPGTSSAEVMALFNKLVTMGMKPKTMTFSIVLKALTACEDYTTALEVLAELPPRFGLATEARLFAQVSQAAIKSHRGKVAVIAYNSMLEATRRSGEVIDSAIHARLLRHCAIHSEFDTANQIRETAARAGLNLEQQDASARRAGPVKAPWRRERNPVESLRARLA